ncbi:MAG: methyltransferase [Acidimicrobiia bacterium]
MSQYFDEVPTVESHPIKVSFNYLGSDLVFTTDRGVFSYEKIDKATRILLDVFEEKFYGSIPNRIVDVGCGYGTIALCLARKFPQSEITAVDINQRAIELCKKNVADNDIENVFVKSASSFDDEKYDLIISNPPIRIGKEAMFDLLKTWTNKLEDNGQMWLVIAKNLGADSTAAYLEFELNLNVKRVASKKGFRILRCEK